MTSLTTTSLRTFQPIIWLVATSFTLLQFTLQLSSAVVINVIMGDMHLSALTGGLLSGLFYVIYTGLQIPAGLLFDRFNPRPILWISAVICATGCMVFASSHHLPALYCGRALIALGSAFSFVGMVHLVRENYPKHLFSVLIGTTETLSFLAGIISIMGLGAFVNHAGWREFMQGAAIIALTCAALSWHYIPQSSHRSPATKNNRSRFFSVLTHFPLWLNGLFTGLTFLLVTVFGGLWAPPFLQMKLLCSMEQASTIDAIYILGVGFSCPIFGYLGNKVPSKKQLIAAGNLMTAALLLMILYLPIHSISVMMSMMFGLGLISGSYILGFGFANELAPPGTLSTATGLTNTLALFMTPILQPWIGRILDILQTSRSLELRDYQLALSILPICLVMAILCLVGIRFPKSTVGDHNPSHPEFAK